MFTQPCYIRCINDERAVYSLCVKLRKFDYEGVQNDSMRYVDSAVHNAVRNSKRNRLYTPIISTDGYQMFIHHKTVKYLDGIDCNTNEELFLAIAALRDDSDYKQWFVCNNDIYDAHNDIIFCNKGEFRQCTCMYFKDFITDYHQWHKATVDELKQHFK